MSFDPWLTARKKNEVALGPDVQFYREGGFGLSSNQPAAWRNSEFRMQTIEYSNEWLYRRTGNYSFLHALFVYLPQSAGKRKSPYSGGLSAWLRGRKLPYKFSPQRGLHWGPLVRARPHTRFLRTPSSYRSFLRMNLHGLTFRTIWRTLYELSKITFQHIFEAIIGNFKEIWNSKEIVIVS